MPINDFWIHALRRIGLLEGASFLLLIFVAMPLKYLGNLPQAVSLVGMIHGLLFVAFCGALLQVMLKHDWPLKRCGLIFVASLLPFGPFLLDQKMRKWSAANPT